MTASTSGASAERRRRYRPPDKVERWLRERYPDVVRSIEAGARPVTTSLTPNERALIRAGLAVMRDAKDARAEADRLREALYHVQFAKDQMEQELDRLRAVLDERVPEDA